MLFDRVIRNLADADGPEAFDCDREPADGRRDVVDLTWAECARRAVRATSRAGRKVGLVLPLGQPVRHGDVLLEDADVMLVVNVVPCRVLVARPRDAREMGVLACELGNLHVPVEVADGELLTPPDGPSRAAVERLGIPFAEEIRRFAPLRISVLTAVGVSADLKVTRKA